jgi:hypothetical protein
MSFPKTGTFFTAKITPKQTKSVMMVVNGISINGRMVVKLIWNPNMPMDCRGTPVLYEPPLPVIGYKV